MTPFFEHDARQSCIKPYRITTGQVNRAYASTIAKLALAQKVKS
jgi:hypothetical protein